MFSLRHRGDSLFDRHLLHFSPAVYTWRLNEIKADRNANVMPDTLSAVLEWIDCAEHPNVLYGFDESDLPF